MAEITDLVHVIKQGDFSITTDREFIVLRRRLHSQHGLGHDGDAAGGQAGGAKIADLGRPPAGWWVGVGYEAIELPDHARDERHIEGVAVGDAQLEQVGVLDGDVGAKAGPVAAVAQVVVGNQGTHVVADPAQYPIGLKGALVGTDALDAGEALVADLVQHPVARCLDACDLFAGGGVCGNRGVERRQPAGQPVFDRGAVGMIEGTGAGGLEGGLVQCDLRIVDQAELDGAQQKQQKREEDDHGLHHGLTPGGMRFNPVLHVTRRPRAVAAAVRPVLARAA